MKKTLLLLMCIFSFAIFNSLIAQCGNLYIGGVVDGDLTGGTPKGIQFCASGDIADLSIYGFGIANNGGGSDGQEHTFPAEMMSSGDCFWITGTGTNPAQFLAFFGFSACYSAGLVSINGDDPIELFCNGTLEDEFGDVANDGTGECWEYTNGWAMNNTGGPNFGAFNCADWTIEEDGLDNAATNATAPEPYPSPAQVCPGPLPVELISFDAKPENDNIVLSWSTASEENNSHFEIEHSANGRDFTYLDKVIGNGTTAEIQVYEYMHADASAGKNYYRLRQVDFDGAFEYSSIVVVEIKTDAQIDIRPTAVSNSLQVMIGEEVNTAIELQIVDIAGRQLQTATIGAGTTQHELEVSDLQNGIYFVQFNVNNTIVTRRFVKL